VVKYKQLNLKDIPYYRKLIANIQNNRCAICGEKLDEGAALDHQHRFKNEPIGENGAGLVRGVLCRRCNTFEGKIFNNTRRFQVKNINEWLKKLIEYWDSPNYPYIHPSEKPKKPKISKRQYNLLKKNYDKKAKFPEFPKSGKLTKKLESLFNEYNISPYLKVSEKDKHV